MKKILPIYIVCILVLSAFGAAATPHSIISQDTMITNLIAQTTSFGDELDQNQTINNTAVPVGGILLSPEVQFNVSVAQSFIPQKEILTKVELEIGRNTTASRDYVVAIRKDLTGSNLAVVSVHPADVLEEAFSWITFDFNDIHVTVGDTYYIVAYTENISDNWYAWTANNNSESYPYGCMWVSIDDGGTWSNDSATTDSGDWMPNDGGIAPLTTEETWDMCFKTYGRDAPQLDVSLKGGFGSISLIIKNIGTTNVTGLPFEFSVVGGILHLINKSTDGIILDIPPDGEVTITLTVLGFGPVAITVTIDGNTVVLQGFVIFFWVIILP